LDGYLYLNIDKSTAKNIFIMEMLTKFIERGKIKHVAKDRKKQVK